MCDEDTDGRSWEQQDLGTASEGSRYPADMDRMQDRRYTYDREQTSEILDLAGELDETVRDGDVGLTRDDLYRIAHELEIDPAAVDKAIRNLAKSATVSAKESKKSVRRRMRFVRHAMAYIITISLLAVVDALGGGGWWFFYIAGFWGIALALHGLRFVTRRNGPLEKKMLGS